MITEEIKQQLLGIERVLHELDGDKARLDWLDKHVLIMHLRHRPANGIIRAIPGTLREAIDEAMKEEP